ncbi:5153_t:CDS:2 [Paraglomus occultum]|uniref:5153_t:CDS:1 n=1 Tax=Paraglomus occultum TaxID=144539 RepID=A0A9N8Z312_9GLOM|nr:5153_t:CDS:2 [Paraglomus occultum]
MPQQTSQQTSQRTPPQQQTSQQQTSRTDAAAAAADNDDESTPAVVYESRHPSLSMGLCHSQQTTKGLSSIGMPFEKLVAHTSSLSIGIMPFEGGVLVPSSTFRICHSSILREFTSYPRD